MILIITVEQSISAHITEYAEAIKLQYTHLVTGLAHARDSSSLGRIVVRCPGFIPKDESGYPLPPSSNDWKRSGNG